MFIKLMMTHATDATDAKGKLRMNRVRLFRQAGGLEEISRGLKPQARLTPPENVALELHSEGVPEFSFCPVIEKSLRPLQGRIRCRLTGGIARRLAQPPANFCQPSGLKSAQSRCSLRSLRPLREKRFFYE